MNDLISKSKLKKELSKIPSEMGLIKKVWVMQTVDKQKAQDSNNTCNCQHNSNSRDDKSCYRCDSRKTNADRIRSMSDEELAKSMERFITCEDCKGILHQKYCDLRDGDCYTKFLNWLQSPVDDEVSDIENFEVRR